MQLVRFHPVLVVLYAIDCAIFGYLTYTDLTRRLLPNRVTYPAIAYGMAAAFVDPRFHWSDSRLNFLDGWLGGLAGGAVFLVLALLARGQLGMGDVKLATFIGLVTGFRLFYTALLLGVVAGGGGGGGLLLTRRRGRKDMIPYGPFLVFGALVVMFFGNQLTGVR
jgi:leader peptidase (prepilin peptidase)/N-methyltransferase